MYRRNEHARIAQERGGCIRMLREIMSIPYVGELYSDVIL